MSNEYKDWYNDFTIEQKKNYELCMKYPFLIPHHRWTGEEIKDYDYTYTELDEIPDGWREAFGEQMCEEIAETLAKLSKEQSNDFRIMQIKEKYGSLRFYTNWHTDELQQVINKYEKISLKICIRCGKPATKISTGWISPYCDECAKDMKCNVIDIDEYFKQWEKDNDN